jgi:hypothetical protein
MNTRSFLIFCIAALAHSLVTTSAEPAPNAQPAALYLHCLAPNKNGDGSTVRLITLRVREFEDIEFAADRPSAIWSLKGRIDPRGGKFDARISGGHGTTTGIFEGEVELEKRFSPDVYGGSLGGRIFFFALVLSHNSDPAPLLTEPFFRLSEGLDSKVLKEFFDKDFSDPVKPK